MEKRTLLAARKILQGQNRAIENDVRGLLRSFGLKVGPTSAGAFDARVRQLVEDLPGLTAIIRPLLEARAAIRSQFVVLHRLLLDLVRDDPVCRRFMTVPGVGAVVSITFQATADIPRRFASSKAVGAHFGLTPRAFSSGETDYTGRIRTDVAVEADVEAMIERAVDRFGRLDCLVNNAGTGSRRVAVAKAEGASSCGYFTSPRGSSEMNSAHTVLTTPSPLMSRAWCLGRLPSAARCNP